jgi:predicted N-acetyltransferase YhbS
MDAATERLLDLMVSAFKPGDAELRRVFRHDLTADPGCPPEHRVVVMDGAEPAASLLIFARHLRLGAAVVPTACIGAVAADPARKGRGFGGRLMDAAHARIRELGLPWVFLIGIDHFYSRLGYRPCLIERLVGVPLADLPTSAGVGGSATMADLPALDALARSSYAGGAWGRERAAGDLAVQLARCGVAVDAIRVLRRGGAVAAWHLRRGDRLWECAAADAEAAAWVWADAGAAAAAEDAARSEIAAQLPAGHPCRRALANRPFRLDGGLKSYGGCLGLILDLPAFVQAVAPELLARATAIGRGGLDLRVGAERFVLGDAALPVSLPDAGILLTALSGIGPAADLPIEAPPTIADALFPVRGNAFTRVEYF